MEDKKISFIKRVKMAIFNFEKYQDFAKEDLKIAIKYFLKLILLFTMVVCIAITYQYTSIAKTGIQIIKEEIPDFVYENNKLESKADKPTIIQKSDRNTNYVIIIDTTIDENSEEFKEYESKLELYNIGAIFLNDKVMVRTGLSNNLQAFEYATIAKQYGLESFDKSSLLEKINNIEPISLTIALYITLVLYLFASYLISTLLETLLLFVLGYFIARIVGVKMKNGAVYGIGLYSLTLSILLNMIYIPVNILTGFEIQYFQVMYTAISYIYLVTAILMMRSDLIKQQMEVQKIEDVQKEVKEEFEKNEEPEEPKKDEKEKDKKNEKDEKKGLDNGEEAPEGTV